MLKSEEEVVISVWSITSQDRLLRFDERGLTGLKSSYRTLQFSQYPGFFGSSFGGLSCAIPLSTLKLFRSIELLLDAAMSVLPTFKLLLLPPELLVLVDGFMLTLPPTVTMRVVAFLFPPSLARCLLTMMPLASSAFPAPLPITCPERDVAVEVPEAMFEVRICELPDAIWYESRRGL